MRFLNDNQNYCFYCAYFDNHQIILFKKNFLGFYMIALIKEFIIFIIIIIFVLNLS